MDKFSPLFASYDLSDTSIFIEDLHEFLNSDGPIRFAQDVMIDKTVLKKELINTVYFNTNKSESYDVFFDSNFEAMLSFVFNNFSTAFSGDIEAQKHILGIVPILAASVEHDNIVGSILITSELKSSSKDEDDDDILAATYVVFTAEYIEDEDDEDEDCEEEIFAHVYMVNNKIVQRTDQSIAVDLNGSMDQFRDFSLFNLKAFLKQKFRTLDVEVDDSDFSDEEFYYYQVMDREENEFMYRICKLIDVFNTDLIGNESGLYRHLKHTGLFTIDKLITPFTVNRVMTVDSFDVAELVEMFSNPEGFDNLSMTDLVSAIEQFGNPDDTDPLEGVVLLPIITEDMRAELGPISNEELIISALFASVSMLYYKIDSDVDPETLLYTEITEMFYKVAEYVGSFITNNKTYLFDDDDDVVTIETSFGDIPTDKMPIWMLILGLPYFNYLMRTAFVSQETEEQLHEEHWFDNPMFTKAVDHLNGLASAKPN